MSDIASSSTQAASSASSAVGWRGRIRSTGFLLLAGAGNAAVRAEGPAAGSWASPGASTITLAKDIDISTQMCFTESGGFTEKDCCSGPSANVSHCWDSFFTFTECCPNADCWQGQFNYESCCSQPGGNPACWSPRYSYEHCCLLDEDERQPTPWFAALFDFSQYDHLYALDEFYNDAQYGPWGYYSTGNVLSPFYNQSTDRQEFAHFTTYPMALSPHFGRVLCRMLFMMWVRTGAPSNFEVFEFGAGSGQLAEDIRECVNYNMLDIQNQDIASKFIKSFSYFIVERSPALAQRQARRGFRVIRADAQQDENCEMIRHHSTGPDSAGVVISNELLDAFAPIRLRWRNKN